jgi:hypothetical protein
MLFEKYGGEGMNLGSGMAKVLKKGARLENRVTLTGIGASGYNTVD